MYDVIMNEYDMETDEFIRSVDMFSFREIARARVKKQRANDIYNKEGVYYKLLDVHNKKEL